MVRTAIHLPRHRMLAGAVLVAGAIFLTASPTRTTGLRPAFKASPISFGAEPGSIVVVDLNSDDSADIVTTNLSGTVTVLLARGDGNFDQPVVHPYGPAAAVATGDVDGDGGVDIVIADVAGRLQALLGTGDGSLRPGPPGSAFGPTTSERLGALAIADFDGDGRDDVAVTTNADHGATTSLWVSRSTGGGQVDSAVRLAEWPQGPVDDLDHGPPVVAGDVNNDGFPDLAAARFGAGPVAIFFGDGHGGFARGPELPLADPVTALAVADMDRDGKADVLAATVPVLAEGDPGTVFAFRGRGGGSFTAAHASALTISSASLTVADFNADNRPDIAVAGVYEGDVSILTGAGAGTFAAPMRYPTGSGGTDFIIADDVDGNGSPDLLTAGADGLVLLRNSRPPARTG